MLELSVDPVYPAVKMAHLDQEHADSLFTCHNMDSVHKDFRSSRHTRNREAKQCHKYYQYRGVDPKWIGQPFMKLSDHPSSHVSQSERAWYQWSAPLVAMPQHLKPAIYTKRDMWLDREDDIWPLDRRHHRGKKIREKHCLKWQQRSMGTRLKQRSRRLAAEVHSGLETMACQVIDDDDIDADIFFAWLWDSSDDNPCMDEKEGDIPEVQEVYHWTSSTEAEVEFDAKDDFLIVYAPNKQYASTLVVHQNINIDSEHRLHDLAPLDDSDWELT